MKKCIYLFTLAMLISCGKDIDTETVEEIGDVNLVGSIIDQEGLKVAGASIELYVDNELLVATESNQDGEYKINTTANLTDEAKLFLKADKSGYSTSFRSVDECDGSQAALSMAITSNDNLNDTDNGNPLDGDKVSVRGRVIDKNGDSGRARAIIIALEGVSHSLVDENGCYEFFVNKGNEVELYFFTGCNTSLIEADEDTPFNYFHKSKTNKIIVEENFVVNNVIAESTYSSFEVTGFAVDCNGSPIEEGTVNFNEFFKFSIRDGVVDATRNDCYQLPRDLQYVIYDGCTGLRSEVKYGQSDGNGFDMGRAELCEQEEHFFNLSIEGKDFVFCDRATFSNQEQYTGGHVYEINAETETGDYGVVMTIEPKTSGVYSVSRFAVFKYSNDDRYEVVYSGIESNVEVIFGESVMPFGGVNTATYSGTYTDRPSGQVLEISGAISIPTTNDFYFN